MRHIGIFSIIFLWLATCTATTFAQNNFWEPTGGPKSAHVTALAIKSADTVFAGTTHGVVRSTDRGDTWVEFGPSNVTVNLLVITPHGDLFAATDSAGIVRSRDNGVSWEPVNTGLARYPVISLATCSTGELVAGMEGPQNGVYRSTDDGDHWKLVMAHNDARIVAINDSGHIYAGSTNGGPEWLARSTDHGVTWSRLQAPGSWGLNHLLFNSRGHIFAGSRFGLFRSTDNGATWDSASSGLAFPWIADLAAASGDTLFAATYSVYGFLSDLYRSTDNGRSWKAVGPGYATTAVAAGPGGLLVAGNVSLYRSVDFGDHWSRLNAGWQDVWVTELDVSTGDTLYARTQEAVFVSTDHGNSWDELMAGTYRPYRPLAGFAVSPLDHLFLLFCRDIGVEAFRSTDHGRTWVLIPLYSMPVFGDSGRMYALRNDTWDHHGVARSTDDGDTWEAVNNGLESRNCHDLFESQRGDLFVATQDSGLYRSTNGGALWVSVSKGLPNELVDGFAVSPRGHLFVVTRADNNAQNVFGSSDNGESWTPLYTMPSWCSDMAADADGNLFLAVDTVGVYRNNVPLNSGLTTLSVASLVMDSRGYLYAGTGNWNTRAGGGVFRSVQATTAVQEPPQLLPGATALEQNWPNPFNPSTTIGYTVGGIGDQGSGARNVKLSIYNVLGQEVAVLVNEQQAPGRYQVRFEGSGCASGVYFYRLQAGMFVQAKKLMLVR